MQQMINNLIQENAKMANTRKRTATNATTQVFSYEPVEDIGSYKNMYKSINNNKIKNAAKGFNDDLDDMDIINFFDTDDE